MSYSIWGRISKKDSRLFSERAFRRAALPEWDARWHTLSVPARTAFLDEVKGPVKRSEYTQDREQPSVAVEMFGPKVLKELTDAGFVEVREPTIKVNAGAKARARARAKESGGRVFAAEGLRDFATRVRALARYHLLDAGQPSMVEKYVNTGFYTSDLLAVINGVLQKVQMTDYVKLEEALKLYVVSRRWPGWVVQTLGDPLAERILGVFRGSEGPLLLSALPGKLATADPDKVRSSLDGLIAYLALFEDLDPKTLDIRVGLLPAVRKEMAQEGKPRRRPPLEAVPAPKDAGPDESIVVGDLRAFLLEVASEPPRLRQDHSLFQKEFERFEEVLEPLPPWFSGILESTPEGRLAKAMAWSRSLKLVKEVASAKTLHLHLVPKGQEWLTRSLHEQYTAIYEFYRTGETPDKLTRYYSPAFNYDYDYDDFAYDYYSSGDQGFLGSSSAALVVAKGRRPRPLWEAKPADYGALREALYSVFARLPLGTFYRLDDLAAHAAFGDENPLLLGTKADQNQVAVYWKGRLVPPLEERREEVGRLMIDEFVRKRLIPLGCVRAAVDGRGGLCIARGPMLAAYFGHAVDPGAATSGADPAATRVVVQPDFSVVIIGPNPAPAAELLPFCERTSRGPGHGALVLKVTREAVVKAVANGLKPPEIVARLSRHASHEVPANVLTEVEGWAAWVRRVSLEPLTVIRCPDRETADRVMAALRKQADRLQDTLVAVDPRNLTTVERQKLREQGIIIGAATAAATAAPKARKKKRRGY